MFRTDDSLFHPLELDSKINLPEKFTFPFYYEPHKLSIIAAKEVHNYLESQTDFEHNFGLDPQQKGLQIGKMFGVMIVKNLKDQLGYLAAFSGKLAESNFISGFVPPIYNTLNKEGFYKKGEAYLNELNAKIDALEANSKIDLAKENIIQLELDYQKTLSVFKAKSKLEKTKRKQQRETAKEELPKSEYNELLEELKNQSIYFHFRLRDLKQEWSTKIKKAEEDLKQILNPIEALKQERRALSSSLQKRLHEQYRFLNSNGEVKDLLDIFDETNLPHPPAGSGECAAPKLFQYAYENELKPIAMAEFWWGVSPKSEVRKHKQFYPSCRGKCEPILGHMMKGLEIETNPMEQFVAYEGDLEILYEDDYLLLVNKPHEFLSVPGRTITDSVYTKMKAYLPDAKGPLLVHRLDMSTSGILLVAKNEKTHKNLQKQFIERTIKKRYVALLDGEADVDSGYIELPLRVDFNNRPRQLVCYDHGKPAKTRFQVISKEGGKTRVYFYPISGRTHQLRVHAAHSKGLHMPIVGDDLYGTKEKRLHLHAEMLDFEHPVKKERMNIVCDAPF
ncbi:pseudouridine synthase [Pontimicrobium sp. IMCC45349]|uniref:RluA family pseudouridine synthase n=1 Tax=Pontimicrobium sp. IMCC45349 TaxID=3391574 RepID=UPI0039A2A463